MLITLVDGGTWFANGTQLRIEGLSAFQTSNAPGVRGINPRQVYVNKHLILLGREEDNDIPLDDKTVSRKHCSLVQQGIGWALLDTSSFGTTILRSKKPSPMSSNRKLPADSTPIQVNKNDTPVPLKNYDYLKIGNIILHLDFSQN